MTGSTDTDQATLWDQWHAERDTTRSRSHLAGMALDELQPVAGAAVLELGCGQGADAVWFAEHGATVIATDLSSVALDRARRTASRRRLNATFLRHDLSTGFPQVGRGFDAIVARLSLHYFTPGHTATLFDQIRHALTPGGLLAFAVKSVNDPACGRGEHLGGNLWRYHGKTRHFFTDDYIEELLAGWEVRHHVEHTVLYESDEPSSVIEVMARSRPLREVAG